MPPNLADLIPDNHLVLVVGCAIEQLLKLLLALKLLVVAGLFPAPTDSASEGLFVPLHSRWVLLRFTVLVALAVFGLAMFDVLPGICLFVGFIVYCISIMSWLYPDESLFPSDGHGEELDIASRAKSKRR